MESFYNWLTRFNFLLQFAIFLAVFQSIDCLTYYPSKVKSEGDHLQGKCSESSGRVARISEPSALANALKFINDGDEYWTGLSWHFNHTFRWYTNESHRADVDQRIINNLWFCFLVSEQDRPKLIFKRCDRTRKFLCEQVSQTSSSANYTVGPGNCNGTQVQEKCAAGGQGGARISDKPSLITALQTIIDNSSYWTGLSLHLIHGFNWYQNISLKANISEDIMPPSLKRWHCFWANKANARLKRRKCNENHYYICEKNESATTRLLTSSHKPMATTSAGIEARLTTTSKLTTSDAIKVTVSSTTRSSNSKTSRTATTLRPTSTTTTFASTATDNYGESSITGLQDSISKIKALNATNRDSLKNATNTISNLFKKLKQLKPDKKSSINVLLATQELESFAIKYGRFHYKDNESNVISEEHYSMKIQKIPAHNKEAVAFSVNETEYSPTTGWVSISLPSTMFKGKGRVKLLFGYVLNRLL